MTESKRLTTTFLLAALATTLSGEPSSDANTPAAPPSGLRVMTFNIKQQNPANRKAAESPNHWDDRKELVFDIIRDHAPDILCLQEPYQHQLDDLLASLPGFGAIGEGRDGEARGEYCSILYRTDRFRTDDSGTFWLSDTPEKPSKTWGHFYHRICTWTRLTRKKSGRSLYIFNTHLDHKSQEAREKSVRLIARRIHEREHKAPFILTGDFNAAEDNPVVTYLLGKHADASPAPVVDSFRLLHPDAKNTGTGNRFSGQTDGIKSDYIFVMPGTGILETSIIRTHKDGRYPSDHYPVTATISIPTDKPSVPSACRS